MSLNIPAMIGVLTQGVKLWWEHDELKNKKRMEVLNSIGQVMHACINTKAYLYDIRILNIAANREKELSIAAAWQDAANAIYHIDQKLFESSQIKALSWADPQMWHSKRAEGVVVKLDLLIEQCEWLKKELDK
ncbi:hypothetical protein ACW5W8_23190 [Aeromonas aquatilis]